MKQKVRKALDAAANDLGATAEVVLEDVPPNRIAGRMLSPGFAQLSPSERQDLIWRHLDDELNAYERTLVSFIVTDTPTEYAILAGER